MMEIYLTKEDIFPKKTYIILGEYYLFIEKSSDQSESRLVIKSEKPPLALLEQMVKYETYVINIYTGKGIEIRFPNVIKLD